METFDPIAVFLDPLDQGGIDYMITGSFASIHYGEPRFTMDIDLVIALDESKQTQWTQLFPEEKFYIPPVETIFLEIARPTGGHFNIIHHETGFKADFYPSRDHPYWKWAIENRQGVTIGNRQRWFAPAEYVMLWKLAYFKLGNDSKHLRDIRSMLQVQGCEMNMPLLIEAVSKMDLESEWALLKQK